MCCVTETGPRGFRGKGVSRRSLHTQCPGPDLTIISAEGVLPEASHLEDRKFNFLPGRYIDNTEDLGVKNFYLYSARQVGVSIEAPSGTP